MGAAGLVAQQLSFAYPGAGRPVLDALSLRAEPGRVLGILGANGCGKSTLCKLLAGLVEPAGGTVVVDGEPVEHSPWHLVQYVPQDVDAAIIAPVVEEDISFGLRNRGVSEEAVDRRVAELLELVGLPGFAHRAVAELSGGERQRLALASALAVEPRYLILDELSAHLDTASADRLLALVQRISRSAHVGVVVVTQRPDECRWFDEVAVIANGEVADVRPPAGVLYDAELLQSAGLAPPMIVDLVRALERKGVMLNGCPLDVTQLREMAMSCSR